ncbi:helix-turn-helix domain-containing protein [Streptomyces sp. CAU 1734]|uniref:helix-turn-helix domain-containing protein n=1 Tax=Streptomyces sp. CAU 1734 TaxID=3140360 RepID=UPI0032618824
MPSTVPPRPSSSAPWSPPANPLVHTAVHGARRHPQSAGRGFRVLRALLRLGPRDEHQLADIARAAGLQPSHASKLLKAATREHLVEHGIRRGTYRLAPAAEPLAPSRTSPTTHRPVRRILEHLQEETGLAVAWHEPHYRPGTGLHLTLVDLLCPSPELRTPAKQQDPDPRTTAAGRAALTYTPAELAVTADDHSLHLPPGIQDTIRSTRIALRRTPGTCTLATPVLRAQHLVAVLSLTGPDQLFHDPLRAQEFAVLLRRSAGRATGPHREPSTRQAA